MKENLPLREYKILKHSGNSWNMSVIMEKYNGDLKEKNIQNLHSRTENGN